ncbi:hypothetical protein CTRI78_v000505 [Colletotrichum trifolii]|uniref:Uncharacterized protein n=1 Tax=Colletotrichum trifolii TaxID=5466 RepID=A0A4V3HXH6_COLTR|nr:hypothetical protein CTRI78_v000505 [Colletotrichum trifolii]
MSTYRTSNYDRNIGRDPYDYHNRRDGERDRRSRDYDRDHDRSSDRGRDRSRDRSPTEVVTEVVTEAVIEAAIEAATGVAAALGPRTDTRDIVMESAPTQIAMTVSAWTLDTNTSRIRTAGAQVYPQVPSCGEDSRGLASRIETQL